MDAGFPLLEAISMDSDALPFERDLDIHYLILQTKDFVVFLDKELDVDWKTTDAYNPLPNLLG